jgi:lipopolysaccharide export system permease protein
MIAAEYLLSFAVCFVFFYLIFFLNQLLYMAGTILKYQIAIDDVLLLLLYASPAIVALSVPFASLVGSLMTVGRISSDSEYVVLQASGISKKAMLMPFVMIGLAASILSFSMNDIFLPSGTQNFLRVYRRLITTTPALELGAYTMKRYQNATFFTGAVEGGSISNLVILDTVETSKRRVILARKASLAETQDASVITLELDDVFVQLSNTRKPDEFEYSYSRRMTYNISLAEYSKDIQPIGPNQMSSSELLAAISRMRVNLNRRLEERRARYMAAVYDAEWEYRERAASGGNEALKSSLDLEAKAASILAERIEDSEMRIYELEYYKKLAIPSGALCFVFLAFPLGLTAKRSGRMLGLGLGIIISFLYYGFLMLAQSLATRFDSDPALAMWLPNIAILVSAAFLAIFRRAR